MISFALHIFSEPCRHSHYSFLCLFLIYILKYFGNFPGSEFSSSNFDHAINVLLYFYYSMLLCLQVQGSIIHAIIGYNTHNPELTMWEKEKGKTGISTATHLL